MKILVLHPLGCHLGFLGCYGNEWVGTPNLDRLAAEGVVFDRHYAGRTVSDGSAPETWGAWTGRFDGLASPGLSGLLTPTARCVRRMIHSPAKWRATLTRELKSWPDMPALAWFDGPDLSPPWDLPDDLLGMYTEDDDVEPWPDAGRDGPVDPGELRRLQSTYASVVTAFDAQLGWFLDRLRDAGWLDDTLIVFTAASGLMLHGRTRPPAEVSAVHEERVHLPLVLRFPDGRHAGMRLPAFTQPTDLLPTFASLLGLDPGPVHGQDLSPLLSGEADEVRPYAVSLSTGPAGRDVALRSGDWLVRMTLDAAEGQGGATRLYVQPDDRWEVNDLALREHAEFVEALEQTGRKFVAGLAEPGPLVYPVFPASAPEAKGAEHAR